MRKRSIRKRASRQGAVLVEAAIAITLLALFFACAVFTHTVYAHKLAKLYEARNEAWGGTQLECENDGEGNPEPAVIEGRHPFDVTLEVGVRTRLGCNEQPFDGDELIAVVEWAIGNGDDVVGEILDLVDSFNDE